MADMSISGVASGIDWDSIVTKLMEKAKAPAYVMLDKRDKLENKKTLFEEFRVALQNLQSTLAPMKLASTFRAKEIEIERLDHNSSYKSVLTARVNADAAINVYDLEVLQLAKGQISRSNQISGTLSATFANSLGSGVKSSYFHVNAGGKKVRVEVKSTDTLEDVANRLNRELSARSLAVTASVLDNKLILKSNNTGLGKTTQNATITRSVNPWDTLENFDVDLSNGGALVVKGKDINGNDREFRVGVDFDIVEGNRIRWRTYAPQYAQAGGTYQITYTAAAGETHTVPAVRSSDAGLDKNVLAFDSGAAAYPGSWQIKIGSTTYTQGVHFNVEGKNVRWMGTAPSAGTPYDVVYTAAGGEEFSLNVERNAGDSINEPTTYADFVTGTATVTQGSKTYTRGVDFDVVQGTGGTAEIRWRPEAGYGAPLPGSGYSITLKKPDGTTVALTANRSAGDSVDLTQYGFEGNGGPLAGALAGVIYNGYDLTASTDLPIPPVPPDDVRTIVWNAPPVTQPLHTGVPKYATDYTVEYTYNTNTFTLSDDGNGILNALGMNLTDSDHHTAAQDAELLLDGEKITRSSNQIGAGYNNELIKGMTLELKGLGRVSMDVSQDAEAAVTAVQNFVSSYNDVMDWINTVITQKEVDASTKATLDSNDFRMKWGALYGNSVLRDAKGNMRRLTSQVYTSSFTSRTGRKAVYGVMSSNGVVNPGKFTVTVGARSAGITVNPGDTLADIAAKINNPKIDGENNPLFYDPDGREYPTPYAKAEVVENKLVITAGTERPVTLQGNNVLSALSLDYQYTMLNQIGIGVKSTGAKSDLALSGKLEFDTGAFMKALENDAEDVSLLVTSFAKETQTWMDNMIKSTQADVTSNVTVAQGAVVREMNAIDTEIKSIDKYLASFEARLKVKQEGLYAQFSAAEVNLSKLMQQASWLSSVTAQLQGAASS